MDLHTAAARTATTARTATGGTDDSYPPLQFRSRKSSTLSPEIFLIFVGAAIAGLAAVMAKRKPEAFAKPAQMGHARKVLIVMALLFAISGGLVAFHSAKRPADNSTTEASVH